MLVDEFVEIKVTNRNSAFPLWTEGRVDQILQINVPLDSSETEISEKCPGKIKFMLQDEFDKLWDDSTKPYED